MAEDINVSFQRFSITGASIDRLKHWRHPDLLTEETGLLFQPGNVEDLEEKIESLVFDDDRLRSMERAARRWAEENLDSEHYYNSLIEIYSQAVKERHK